MLRNIFGTRACACQIQASLQKQKDIKQFYQTGGPDLMFWGKYPFKVAVVTLYILFKCICNSCSCGVQPEGLSAPERALKCLFC